MGGHDQNPNRTFKKEPDPCQDSVVKKKPDLNFFFDKNVNIINVLSEWEISMHGAKIVLLRNCT